MAKAKVVGTGAGRFIGSPRAVLDGQPAISLEDSLRSTYHGIEQLGLERLGTEQLGAEQLGAEQLGMEQQFRSTSYPRALLARAGAVS